MLSSKTLFEESLVVSSDEELETEGLCSGFGLGLGLSFLFFFLMLTRIRITSN